MQAGEWQAVMHVRSCAFSPVFSQQQATFPQSTLLSSDGKHMKVDFSSAPFKHAYHDEYTGEVLPQHLVQEAIAEELAYFNSVVWESTDKATAETADDYKLVRTRWVMCNKGDLENPDVRARLVACEVNDGSKNDAYFASTPPLEAKKLLFSNFASRRYADNGDKLELSFVVVKKGVL